MSTLPRLALVATVTSLLLAACANHPATRSNTASAAPSSSHTTSPHTTRASASESPAGTNRHSQTHRRSESASAATSADDTQPERTGIPACDDYLSSYMACHRAAAVYSPEQLPLRYQAMRTSLLRDSKNPKVRPYLADRCNSLATTLRQALHGKACDANPAPASSSP
ncbi:MAG: hypothetical protein ABI268_07595 [Rhodanobacter sp.]